MNDAELLANIKAREELQRRGYRWERCPMCKGSGVGPLCGNYRMPCLCGGRGGTWKAPITK